MFGSWQVIEKLGGTDRYTEYRAKHNLLGAKAGQVRLRVYRADPYLEETARKDELKKISNAFVAVQHMSAHSNVLAVRDLIQSDDGNEITLVTDDISGQALRQHLKSLLLRSQQIKIPGDQRCTFCIGSRTSTSGHSSKPHTRCDSHH